MSFDFEFEKGYTYTFTCNDVFTDNTSTIYYTYDNILAGNKAYLYYLGIYSASSANFTITPIRNGKITFLMHNPGAFYNANSTDLWTISKVSSSSLSSIGSNISQGNQLQQEQNQLQQEQNDLIKDDSVNTDGFEFATNDTNNPTEEGFNTLFTSIYNAFCNTSSAPLTITLPYVNETFTIQPNLVSNAMQKMRFGRCCNVNSILLLLLCLSFYI